jgi:hypothetical protein
VKGTLQFVRAFPRNRNTGEQTERSMNNPRYTETSNLSGCCIKVDNRVHGLFVAKRVLSQISARKWVRPEPRQETRS